MSDDGVGKIGTMLEQLGARFDLVIEAVTGYGGRLDTIRDDIFAQFAEVGRQIRFLSDQIAQNRNEMTSMRADLSAEMIRLGETLGATRVEFRSQLAGEAEQVRRDIAASAEQALSQIRAELARASALAGAETTDGHELRGEVAAAAEDVIRKLTNEIKATGKTLATLTRKFDRFDDRITVQTRDQDQRLRKLERKAR